MEQTLIHVLKLKEEIQKLKCACEARDTTLYMEVKALRALVEFLVKKASE
jgi:hypothetical protein